MGKVGKMLPILLLLVLLVALPAAAQKPDFGPHVIVDGVEFGTKAVTALPENEHNEHSFDNLYVFPGLDLSFQPLIGDSKPGDTDYNGGRWKTFWVQWLGTPVRLESDTELHAKEAEGELLIHEGSPPSGAPPDYFECPLLPVLE